MRNLLWDSLRLPLAPCGFDRTSGGLSHKDGQPLIRNHYYALQRRLPQPLTGQWGGARRRRPRNAGGGAALAAARRWRLRGDPGVPMCGPGRYNPESLWGKRL